jgi:hypothetical protein
LSHFQPADAEGIVFIKEISWMCVPG